MLTELELTERLAQFEQVCQRACVKVTHQRREILTEVLRHEGHPSAEDVLEGVKTRVPSVALDTVYRTLWMLADLGLVATLGPRRGIVRFEQNPRPHHHFVCTVCHSISDVEALDLSPLELEAHTRAFGEIEAVHLEIAGICHRCRGARTET